MSAYFTYEADELLAEAIMSSTPIIIVEGSDDVPFYEEIVKSLDKEIEVYASENLNISNGTSGCNGVKTCLKEIRDGSNGVNFTNHILGIIDKDASIYRGDEDLDLEGLFILKYYSIESHFVNKENIKHIINRLTNTSTALLDSLNLENEIFEDIKIECKELYYVSLEALKGECDSNYSSDYRYSHSIHKIINDNYEEKLSTKITDLDTFANSKGITNSFNNLLLIIKGKWLLEYFVLKMKDIMQNLTNTCSESKLCQFCKAGDSTQCAFKLLFNYNKEVVKPILFKNIDISELDYIKDEISKLSA